MVRAVAMSAASALCLIWAAGCASTSEPAVKAASTPPAAKTADATPGAMADPANLAKDLPTTLEGEIKRAQQLRSDGNYDEAAHSFAQLLLVAPDDARVVGGYGKVLEQQGHSQEALAFLKRGVQIDANDWSLQSALGIAYDQMDDHTSARAAYQRALALKPGDASVLNNYAVSRMLAGDYTNAKRMFAQAEAKGVSNPKIAFNLDKLASLDDVSAASTSTPPNPPANVTSAPAAGTAIGANRVAVANLGAPPAQPVVQPLAIKLSPNPIVTASTPHKTPVTVGTTRSATAVPKVLASTVVMEKVPLDPLAGPRKHKAHPGDKLASTSHQPAKATAPKATATAAAPVAPPPALRTAADGD